MYQIIDEPKPGKWEHLVVNPIWPLFGFMFGGSWLAFPWFVFNAIAIGCPETRKIITLALAGFLGSLVILTGIIMFNSLGYLSSGMMSYAALAIVVWKLGICYYLYILQSRTFQIYEYFGGIPKNGIIVVILGLFFGRKFVLNLFDTYFWTVMVM